MRHTLRGLACLAMTNWEFSGKFPANTYWLAGPRKAGHPVEPVTQTMKNTRQELAAKEVFHLTAFFSGRVQGVGFRYHTLQVAKEFDVSGYVRNLSDGRVQLEAEGNESEVRAFCAEVQDKLSVFIRKTELAEERRAPVYRGFSIGF